MRYFVSYVVEFLALLVSLATFLIVCIKVNNSFRYRVLCAYYLLATTLIGKTLLAGQVANANIYSILYVITSLALSYYFFELFSSRWKKGIAISTGLGALVYYLQSLQRPDSIFDSLGYAITSIGIVLLIFLYLHQLFTNVTDEPLHYRFDFWFICSQTIYHLGSFVIFLTFHRLVEKIMEGDKYSHENRVTLTYLWGIHNVLLFLGSLLTVSGLLWIIYRKKSQLS